MFNSFLKITLAVLLLLSACKGGFDIDVGGKLFSKIPSRYSGIDFENTLVQSRENNHLLNVEFVSGAGVAVGDVNNDGYPDIFFAANQRSDRLYLNKGDFKFEDISKKAGISQDDKWSTAATFIDIDHDGDQDIYVSRFVYLENELSANQLYINNGDLTFSERAKEFGIADQGFSTSATFCDFDKDNLVDLYITNQPPSIPGRRGKISRTDLPGIQFSDRLYKNIDGGKFIDITDKSGIRNFGFGLSALTGDFNHDGWQDLCVSNDFDVADHLYINNQDGTFTDRIKDFTRHITNFSMGSDAADYDNDGYLDLMVVDMVHEDKTMRKAFMTNIDTKEFILNISRGVHHQYMTNTLQRNNGNNSFSELARLAGVDKTGWSWGPLFADFDNDGFKDIFITNGVIRNNLQSDLADLYDQKLDSLREMARLNNQDPNKMIDVFAFVDLAPMDAMPNYIYKNNGDHTFSDQHLAWGLDDPTTSNGAAYADLDLDGDIDLVVNNANAKAGLYRNNTIEKEAGNYIRFKLISEENKAIVGSKVTIYKGDNAWQNYHIINSRGFRSKSESIAHFGLGNETEVSLASVVWPDQSTSVLRDLEVNKLYTIEQSNTVSETSRPDVPRSKKLFKDVTVKQNPDRIRHMENTFDDFAKDPNVPYKLSYNGPVIAVGDVNADALDDFYFGGSAEFPGRLFIQKPNGFFEERKNSWTEDNACEDTDASFSDVDGDGDLDLLVTSGGCEFSNGNKWLKDRLYKNDGNGLFTKDAEALPNIAKSSSCAVFNDFDNDGDPDLFIGARLIPGKYPYPASSLLLENRGGRFFDATSEKAPELTDIGMVTSACWTDTDLDGRDDLVLVGEWMPITLFLQTTEGSFLKSIPDCLGQTAGWYYTIQVEDMDHDGDDDFIIGNLGLNYSYTASIEAPFQIFAGDLDLNGSNDILLSYTEEGISYPVFDRQQAIEQIPALEKKFESFDDFSKASLKEIYGELLDEAIHLHANNFASVFIENRGNLDFLVKPLPNIAQASTTNAMLVNDFNLDGNLDILIAGNNFQTEIRHPRIDAGTGLYLKGDGAGNFDAVGVSESGFYAPLEVQDMKFIKVGQRSMILMGNNNSYLQVVEHIEPDQNL